jgi:hypothetical protein
MSMRVDLSKDAEALVDDWIHSNYKGVLAVNYHSVQRKEDFWKVEGEIEIKTSLFGTKREEFSMKVDAGTGKVERS